MVKKRIEMINEKGIQNKSDDALITQQDIFDIQKVIDPDIVKKICLNEILNTAISNVTRCVTPYATVNPFALGIAYTNSQLMQVVNNLLDKHKLYSEATVSISENLINHALEKMPEIEREVKDRVYIQQRLNKITNSLCTYLHSKYAYYANIVASITSIVVLTVSVQACPGILVSMIPAYIFGKWQSNADKKAYDQSREKYQEGSQRFGKTVYTTLSDVQSNYNTDIKAQKIINLNKETGSFKEIIVSLSKKISYHGLLSALGYYAIVGSSMAVGFWQGSNLESLAGIMIGTGMFTSAVTGYFSSKTNKEKNLQDTLHLYREFRHNPIYDLTYGKEKCLPNTDTICLNKIVYSHRDSIMYNKDESLNENLGQRAEQPIIQSDKVFTITKGITVLSGPSGIGKSTLYKLLRYGDNVTSGEISYGVMENGVFKGKGLSCLQEGALSDVISFGNQFVDKDGQSNVVEFIKQGNPFCTDKDIETVCRILNLNIKDEKEEYKPFSCLSGGETKKAVFLRAAISSAPILVFDEPTSGVAADDLNDILNYVNVLGKNKTVIYTTHHPEDLKHLNVSQIIEMTPTYAETGEQKACVLESMPCETKEDIENYINHAKNRRDKTKPVTSSTISRKEAEAIITQMICLDIARRAQQYDMGVSCEMQADNDRKSVKAFCPKEQSKAHQSSDKGFVMRLFQRMIKTNTR